ARVVRIRSRRESDPLPGAFAAVVRLRSGAQRPTRIRGHRYRYVGQPDARDVVAIAVRPGDEARIDGPVERVVLVSRREDRRRVDGRDPGVVVAGAVVEEVAGGLQAGIGDESVRSLV